MNRVILNKNSEEIFLILLMMSANPINNSTKSLLMMNASLQMMIYLENKVNNINSALPEIEYFEDDDSDDKITRKVNKVYQRLLRIVNLYENIRNRIKL